jgi:hypothetical protein
MRETSGLSPDLGPELTLQKERANQAPNRSSLLWNRRVLLRVYYTKTVEERGAAPKPPELHRAQP